MLEMDYDEREPSETCPLGSEIIERGQHVSLQFPFKKNQNIKSIFFLPFVFFFVKLHPHLNHSNYFILLLNCVICYDQCHVFFSTSIFSLLLIIKNRNSNLTFSPSFLMQFFFVVFVVLRCGTSVGFSFLQTLQRWRSSSPTSFNNCHSVVVRIFVEMAFCMRNGD